MSDEAAPGTDRPQRGAATVIVASTAGARGERTDTTGPVIVEWLRLRGFQVSGPTVVADAAIAAALRTAVAGEPRVIITTGGTGVSPSDETPEATRPLLTRELPGIAEEIRRRGAQVTPTAVLSRALAGIAGTTFVVNLPGSPGGVRDGLAVLDEILEHVLDQVGGDARHDS